LGSGAGDAFDYMVRTGVLSNALLGMSLIVSPRWISFLYTRPLGLTYEEMIPCTFLPTLLLVLTPSTFSLSFLSLLFYLLFYSLRLLFLLSSSSLLFSLCSCLV
jgi:hypothetical protein